MNVYKFSETATDVKPDTEITRFLEKVMQGGVFSRQEKDRLTEILYDTFGCRDTTYKLMGWAWPMREHLQEFIVDSRYYGLKSYFALDKTSLRKSLKCIGKIRRILFVKKRG